MSNSNQEELSEVEAKLNPVSIYSADDVCGFLESETADYKKYHVCNDLIKQDNLCDILDCSEKSFLNDEVDRSQVHKTYDHLSEILV